MGGNAAKARRRAERQKNISNTKEEESKTKAVSKDNSIRKKAEKKIPVGRKTDQASKVKFKVGVEKAKSHKGIQSNKNNTSSSKNKIKKPKHLSRKMKLTNDPDEMEVLLKKEQELKTKKANRAERFKAKVIDAVGGPENFNEEAYIALMKNGGGNIETIIRAVKIASDCEAGANEEDEHEPSQSTRLHIHEVDLSEGAAKEQPVASADCETLVQQTASSVQQTTDLPPKLSSCDSSSSDSSDDEIQLEDILKNKRTRGRKHRGRKEATASTDNVPKEEQKDTTSTQPSSEAEKVHGDKKAEVELSASTRKKEKRRCIGRKPLTDFKVGTKYTGTVRYVKPNLGLFIDIGCHYDAFCHISRASDDFVENLNDMFQVGEDLMDKVRVVEIDRAKKRITVSLQSDNRIQDELKSSRDHKERLEAKATKKRKVDSSSLQKVEKLPKDDGNNSAKATAILPLTSTHYSHNKDEVPINVTTAGTEKSLAELKRERKLQRRAERRQQKELSTESA